MTPEYSQWENVTARLEKLERENRRLKQVGAVALVLVASVLLMGQAKQSRTIEAERIRLLDSHGRARLTIGTPGSSGVAIDMKPDEPAIWLSDERGTDRAIITTDGLRLADAKGKPRADKAVEANEFVLKDASGKVRGRFAAAFSAAYLELLDRVPRKRKSC